MLSRWRGIFGCAFDLHPAMLATMRIVFMGSPDFALPALQRLIDSEHELVAVYTQPDRPTGRGRKLAPPPVKTLALQHNLPVYQPASISHPDAVAQIRALAPDLGVIAAYGQILRQRVLDVPRLGILNVHASLLPRWRGAAPIPAAILAGDAETGATIMRVVRALDAGPMLAAIRLPIAETDTTATLTPRIAEAGAALLLALLPTFVRGEMTPTPQDESLATYAPQIEKEDGRIDWQTETAERIARKVRAYDPWPMAFTTFEGQPLRILECIAITGTDARAPGTVVARQPADVERIGFRINTVDGCVGVISVQPAGRGVIPADAYVRGRRDLVGTVLGT